MSTVNNGPQIVRSGLVLDLDASYMRSYSPNVMPNPTDIFAWCGGAGLNSCTISRDTSMTRQYGSIPLKMTVTGNDAYIASYTNSFWNLAPAANGQVWTVSVYAKASVATSGELFLFGADSSGNYGGAGTYGGSAAISITTSWTRVSASFTISGVNVAYVQVRLDGPNSGGSGQTIWWDGLQVERASTATRFNPYYFGNTTWRNSLGTGFNATLVNAPVFTSSNLSFFTCDSSQNFTVSNPLNQSNLTQEWSVCAWVNIDTVTGAGARYLISGLNNGVAVEWFDSGSLLYLNDGANDYYTYGNSIEGSGWIMLSFLFRNSGAYRKIFSNTTDITTSGPNNTSTPSGQSGTFTIANNMRGKISSLMIYNRLLSTTEISANYEAMKTRFGL
jgi:hypothetical protein